MSLAPFRCYTLGYAPGLTHRHETRLEGLSRDKHSGLLRKYVTYGRKKVYNTGSPGHAGNTPEVIAFTGGGADGYGGPVPLSKVFLRIVKPA